MRRRKRHADAARTLGEHTSSAHARGLVEKRDTTPAATRAESVLWSIVVAGTIVVPMAFSPSGQESFRLPQELLLRALGIALAAVVAVVWIWRGKRPSWLVLSPLPAAIVGLIALWTTVATLMSSRVSLSMRSLVTALSAAMLFIAVAVLIRRRSLRAIYWIFIPVLANAGFYLLQEFRIWNPLTSYAATHSANGALLGNPNDVGAFLVLPTLAAGVLIAVNRGIPRLTAVALTAFLTATLFVTQTLTAIVALAGGAAALAVAMRPRRLVAILFGSVVLGLILLLVYSPVRQRVLNVRSQLRDPAINQVLSGRMTAWLVAWEMGRDHPVFGVGPGMYGPHYFMYKLRVDAKYPRLAAWPEGALGSPTNFGEAHSDHLQVLAETGWLGYILFIAALVVLANQSTPPREKGSRLTFAQLLALPAAAAFGVLALAQFPLRLAGVMTPELFLAAACFAWGKQ